MLLEVAVSGTVGKQVVATTSQTKLKGVLITPSAQVATVKIRDGNASGEVVFYAVVTSAGGRRSEYYKVRHNFTKGMHVKVLGTASVAYLDLD